MKKLWLSEKNTNIYITPERENKQESEKKSLLLVFLKKEQLYLLSSNK